MIPFLAGAGTMLVVVGLRRLWKALDEWTFWS